MQLILQQAQCKVEKSPIIHCVAKIEKIVVPMNLPEFMITKNKQKTILYAMPDPIIERVGGYQPRAEH